MSAIHEEKRSLLCLMDILLRQTDALHPLSLEALCAAVEACSLKTSTEEVLQNITLLQAHQIDIVKTQDDPPAYFARRFDLQDLKLLVDAVQRSYLLPRQKNVQFIQQLSTLTSENLADQLVRPVFLAGRTSELNESMYQVIDAIYAAIHTGHKLEFRYFDYDTDKRRVFRQDGATYCHTPVALCWSQDLYYLVCYSEASDAFTHFRADRMSDAAVCLEAGAPFDPKRFNVLEHVQKIQGMDQGEIVRASLRFDNRLINDVIDRFGKDILIRKYGAWFEITTDVPSSPDFLSWLFHFGEKAQILQPESLREAMRFLISQTATQYQ